MGRQPPAISPLGLILAWISGFALCLPTFWHGRFLPLAVPDLAGYFRILVEFKEGSLAGARGSPLQPRPCSSERAAGSGASTCVIWEAKVKATVAST